MELVIEKLVEISELETRAEASMKDCNSRDLCMDTHG